APFKIGADPNRNGNSPNRTVVAPNRNVVATKVSRCIDDPNRIVASLERLFTEQMVNVTNEQCKVQAATISRRQVRQKYLEDILNTSPCPSKKGKHIKSKSRTEVVVLPQFDETLKQVSLHIEIDSVLEVNDSQILNMNRLHCNTSPSGQLEPNLTPCQIWDFIEQIGVRDKTNLEDVV
ncbi:hypothetical protein Ancab_017472, partial [Ancistrocladus abbreviatus]